MTAISSDLQQGLAEAFVLERRLLQARISLLEALCAEHGIPLPESDPALGAAGREHLEASKAVVHAAYDLLERLEELKGIVGSGMELLQPFRR